MAHDSAPVDPDAPVQDDPSAVPTAYIAVVGVLLTAISILICSWIYYATDSLQKGRNNAKDVADYNLHSGNQKRRIAEPRVVEPSATPEESIYGVPIDRAMSLVVEQYGK